MNTNKHVAKSVERQQIRYVRHFYRSIADINLALNKVHKQIELAIDKEKYQYVSDYVNQYISYTSVWNVKFAYNLESPEVALLQIFHLEYIFNQEAKDKFLSQRSIFAEQMKAFDHLKPYSPEQIRLRKQNMLEFILKHLDSDKQLH